MQKILLAGLLVLAVAFSGCITNDDALNLAYALPDVQAFLEQNPEAGVKAVYLSQDDVSADIDLIREKCGEQMQEAPYYYVAITQGDQTIEVYTDSDATRVLCLLKPPASGQDGGGLNGGEQNGGGEVIQDPVQLAEKKFEETVCGVLPTNAMHLNTVWYPSTAILIPSTLDEQLRALGGNLAFLRPELVNEKGVYANSDYSGDKYYLNCWRDAGPNTHLCIIPITMNLTDETGNQTTENGAIKLTFTGTLEPLQPDNSDPCPGIGDCGVPTCYPYCDAKPVPTYNRTACEIDIEKPCPEKPDSVLCGQCQYKNFWDDATQVSNLGQCRYCPKGTTCYWSVSICGSFSCIGSGGANNNPTNLQKYFTSCSACQYGQRSYYYNGYDYATCNYYYAQCIASDCADKRTNCG